MDTKDGNLIRILRQKLGVTQQEFADEVGVAVCSVNRWENAHTEPNRLAWKAIAELARRRGFDGLAATAEQPHY